MTLVDLPHSPAADRNKGPILDVLRGWLPPRARVLEVASGTGQHAQHMAAACPGWHWQPSEAQDHALDTLAARCAGLDNVAAPLRLDLLAEPWPPEVPASGQDAVVCINLLHIAPWSACEALMRAAARWLHPGGLLAVYGPFIVDGVATASSNLAFDEDLKRRDARWGLRRLHDVVGVAQAQGLELRDRVALPANNLLLAFRPAGRPDNSAA